MIELYYTKNERVYDKLKELLSRHITGAIDILRTPLGKPYLEGNPLYFSISHCRDRAVIALCDKPVGVDIQFIENGAFEKYAAILSRLCERERKDIGTSSARFFRNWTLREAFVKMNGGSVFAEFKNLEILGDDIYNNGEKTACGAYVFEDGGFAVAVCADGYDGGLVKSCQIQKYGISAR